MTEVTFYARVDSSSANNPSVIVQNVKTTPTTALTFTNPKTGDIRFDCNGGAPDPDTRVIIGGTTYRFTVEMTGTLPTTDKYSDVGGIDLRGAGVAVITVNSQRYFFLTDGSGTFAVMDDFPNGATPIDIVATGGPPVLICLVQGTPIATPSGERRIEELTVGDRVIAAFGQVRTIRWIGRRRVSCPESLRHPQLRPVPMPAGSLGGWKVDLNAGCSQAPVPARHFPGGAIHRAPAGRGCTRWLLLLDDQAPVLANGVPAESFQPAPRAVADMEPEARDELRRLFPDLVRRPEAAPTLRAAEDRAVLSGGR